MRKARIAVTAFLCMILFSTLGCTHQPEVAKTLLTKDEVIMIAKNTVKSEGLDIQKYNMTGCYYEYTAKDEIWTVFFVMKPPTPPGGHFLVWVSDKTKKAKLMRGQ